MLVSASTFFFRSHWEKARLIFRPNRADKQKMTRRNHRAMSAPLTSTLAALLFCGAAALALMSFVIGARRANAQSTATCIPVPTVNDKCPAWVATYDNSNGHLGQNGDRAAAVITSPAGDRVYVTGFSQDNTAGQPDPTGTSDFLTAAYDSASGTQLWTARYNGPQNGYDIPYAIALSPTGDRI